MELTVLGSSGGCAAPGNPASGYLITHGDTTIWCDAGSGNGYRLGEPFFIDITDGGRCGLAEAAEVEHPPQVPGSHAADPDMADRHLIVGPGKTARGKDA